MDVKIVLGIILFRVLNSFIITTFFSPDEYYQSLEVAHNLVFGTGYLSWEWQRGTLRSIVYPLFYAFPFWILKQTSLDSTFTVIFAAKLVNGLVAALRDVMLIDLVWKHYKKSSIMNWVMFFTLFSWFDFYSLPRSFSNSMESALFVTGIWMLFNGRVFYATLTIGLSVMVRPTSLIQWMYPMAALFFENWHNIVTFGLSGVASFIMMVLIDSIYYQKVVVSILEFLKFNVLHNLSLFYGYHPWHWYLSQGLPLISTLEIAIFPQQLLSKAAITRDYLIIIFSSVLLYSFLGHKEFRFLHPILSLIHVCSACVVDRWSRVNQKIIFVLFILVNVPLGLYSTMVHQRGVIQVMHYLNDHFTDGMDVFFMMPCHSTPMFSYLHHEVKLDMITCEPPTESVQGYKDESDIFYENPIVFMENLLESRNSPMYIVFFESLEQEIKPWLLDKGYDQTWRTFNSHFHDDSRRKGDVIVYKLNK